MIDTGHSRLSLSRQCSLIGLNQSSYYYEPAEEKESSRCNLPKSKNLANGHQLLLLYHFSDLSLLLMIYRDGSHLHLWKRSCSRSLGLLTKVGRPSSLNSRARLYTSLVLEIHRYGPGAL
jgi:hypothetical protein